jgi:hypothetical protein
MGGDGSGRRLDKELVENCAKLDIDLLHHREMIIAGEITFGSLVCHFDHDFPFRIEAKADAKRMDRSFLLLEHSTTDYLSGRCYVTSQKIQLEFTRPNFGGVRCWARCPLEREGERCSRRVLKLYKPFDSSEFGCRACHNLTYRSSRESHRYDGLVSKICEGSGLTFEEVKEYLRYVK